MTVHDEPLMTVDEYRVLLTLLGEINRHHDTADAELDRCKWWAVWRWSDLRRAGRALERSNAAFDCYRAVKTLFMERRS